MHKGNSVQITESLSLITVLMAFVNYFKPTGTKTMDKQLK